MAVSEKEVNAIQKKFNEPTAHEAKAAAQMKLPPSQPGKSRLSALIGLGKGTYGNTKAIDEYVRNERDSWDS